MTFAMIAYSIDIFMEHNKNKTHTHIANSRDCTKNTSEKERKRNEHTQTKCISKYPRTHRTNIARWVR